MAKQLRNIKVNKPAWSRGPRMKHLRRKKDGTYTEVRNTCGGVSARRNTLRYL